MATEASKIYAISDLHVNREKNRRSLQALCHHPDDWLIVAGDVSHSAHDLAETLSLLASRFKQVLWTPGNHELWSHPDDRSAADLGVGRYEQLVRICREHRVLTPEDPYPAVRCGAETYVVAPLFLLYDYSFAPPGMTALQAVQWAMELDVLCADEHYLQPYPYATRAAWCAARCHDTAARLAAVGSERPLILVNHFPLRRDHVRIAIPRFEVWCGTTRSEDWHRRFNVSVVVYGHLHVPRTRLLDGVRFEEVSLGYPGQWRGERGIEGYLRQILPAPAHAPGVDSPHRW